MRSRLIDTLILSNDLQPEYEKLIDWEFARDIKAALMGFSETMQNALMDFSSQESN